MTDKKLSETTDQEMILEYVEQLKQDNKRLKKELDAKNRPVFDFTSVTKLLRDIADHGFTQTVFGISIAAMCVLALYGLISWSGTTGRYYVERDGNHVEVVAPENECECPEPERITKPCFKVMSEFRLGEDDEVEGCFFTKEDAYKAAREFAEEWKRLNGRQENE